MRLFSRFLQAIVFSLVCAVLFPVMSIAAVIDFYQIGKTSADAHYFGELNNKELTIHNTKKDSYISRFYFYCPSLDLKIDDVEGYTSPARPAHLPELYSPPIQADASFQFKTPLDRISYNESITFKLQTDLTNAELVSLFQNKSLVSGIFIQDYEQGESAHLATSAVPVPPSLALFISGLAGLVWTKRKIRKTEASQNR